MDAKTADRWLGLLQLLFLVQRVPAWSGSALKRLVRVPKLHFLDSGLLAALQGVDAPRIARDRTALGSQLRPASREAAWRHRLLIGAAMK